MIALVLAGGYGKHETGILRAMTDVRRALALDLAERLLEAQMRVILLSDDEELAAEANRLGCGVRRTRDPFSWLEEVREAVRACADPEEAVLVLGGSAAPLLTEKAARDLAARAEPGSVWQNNRLSPDLVLFQPAQAVFDVRECRTDNDFGYALERQAGLRARYLPRELAYSFDVDTGLDALLAAAHGQAGARLRASASKLRHRVPINRVLEVLRRGDYPDVAILGRVHPVDAEQFGQQVGVRLRLYSEERGMKALGRIERGEVRSLTGALADALGVTGLCAQLGALAQCAFWDTRVLLAERGIEVGEGERMAADLGLVEEVRDPRLRELVQAAGATPIPILLGGQTLVSGGLRVLAETARFANGK